MRARSEIAIAAGLRSRNRAGSATGRGQISVPEEARNWTQLDGVRSPFRKKRVDARGPSGRQTPGSDVTAERLSHTTASGRIMRAKIQYMARPLRLEHPGAIWHVTSRGNARQDIFRDDLDRARFVAKLGDVVSASRWRLHAWVLMSNHFHLLLETPDPNLARGMQQLNSSFSQAFNRRHRRVGHVLQGRYKGILVERESHLLELVRYVVLNPVRAGIALTPAKHRWSSYTETAGLRKAAAWLDVDWTLAQFARLRSEARRRFRRFVSEGRGADYRPWDDLGGRVCLGSEGWVTSLAALADTALLDPEIPRAQKRLSKRPSLGAVHSEVRRAFGASEEVDMARRSSHPARKAFALLARRCANARLSDIGGPLGVLPRSASSLLSAAQALEDRDREFKRRVRECQDRLIDPGINVSHPKFRTEI